ncbi:MAG: exo-alpha-sialidase, partial [Candidatus Hydrogenedentes bacterium]|nr:exo-alpha-sialidase [Candidatus Hydrogenedentota bacterium]
MRIQWQVCRFLVFLTVALPAFAVNFSAPDTLNSNAAADSFNSDQYADIAVGANGTWIAVWKRGVPSYLSAGDIHYSRSTNNGSSWSALDKIGGQDVDNDDTNPRVATDGAGNWVCVWESGVSEADIFVSYSTNDGVSWSNEAYLNSSMESDSAQDGAPSIATDGDGNWIVTWRSTTSAGTGDESDLDIFYSKSTNAGANWSVMAPLNSNAT